MDMMNEKAKPIRLAIFDVDGVLTDGKLVYGPNGIEYKEFHVHDGQGMKYLQKSGVELAIITACTSPIVAKRMKDLGINHIYQGVHDKLSSFEELKLKLALTNEQIAYIGDDLPDLPIITRVGLGMTVANAPEIMRQHAPWTTKAKGGRGAAREFCEIIMRAQGTYEPLIQAHLYRKE